MKAPKNITPLIEQDEGSSWKKEWVGMPEFIQNNLQPFQSVVVHFETEEDRNEFAKLVDQKITLKTRFIWYPKLTRENLKSKICIDE